MHINDIAARHYEWVDQMGWHKNTVLGQLALIASEVGEAVAECEGNDAALVSLARITEAIGRAANECRGDEPTDKFGSELADIILRVLDLAVCQKIDIGNAIETKMSKNLQNGSRGRKI